MPRQARRVLSAWYGAEVVTGRNDDYRFTQEVTYALDRVRRASQLTAMEPPTGLREDEYF